MASKSKALLETASFPGPYGFECKAAIIDHDTQGRILLFQRYGGVDWMDGGATRWRHGVCARLLPSDTFESLNGEWNSTSTVLDAVLAGADDSRPLLEWNGIMIDRMARSVGL